ncbi:MAG: [Synergistaceae bacterium]|nr:[citrate (pro-3S)-lyase] ligase [Synergistaceae bacterium]MBQ6738244.1 [citrate (pro-3S)-lyase] ligase [Synergistaceae bacterium]
MSVSKVYKSDKRANSEIEKLLQSEGIRRDKNLDYTCAVYDEDYKVIATGSCFGNTLRCMAVSHEHQGEGLMNEIVSHLIQYEYERKIFHLFLYTKCNSAKFFGDLGFYEIVRVENQIVFMENRKTGFNDYLTELSKTKVDGEKIAALVLNANPFTLGHLYLVEKASRENDFVHVFIVSEDMSLVPFDVRKKLVIEGTSHLKNLIYHETGDYIISSATFPSYFQKDDSAVIESHANLDLSIFVKIAKTLGINSRYVGEEPKSLVTGIYNRIMSTKLPEHNINCVIVPRKTVVASSDLSGHFTVNGEAISASNVRQAIKNNEIEKIKNLVPESTYKFFTSPDAEKIINRIRGSENVVHY